MSRGPLAFLHTAPSNVSVFDNLLNALAPGLDAPHELIEDVLAEAVAAGGITPAMRARTAAAVHRLARAGAALIVCTCSTIGAVAEDTPVPDGVCVIRIDRAMAERAVASGRRIVVAAALPSTLGPTRALIEQVADAAGRRPVVIDVLCGAAWAHLAAGRPGAYAEEIARAVCEVATPADVVVLAQASMAPAARLLETAGLQVLSSPELGLRAALDSLNAAAPKPA